MKVILLKNIVGIGKAGEIKDLADGYVRNYLLPRALAHLATEKNIVALKQQKDLIVKRTAKNTANLKKAATQLNGQKFELVVKANEAGTLYAAIGPAQIASLLTERGYAIEAKQVVGEVIKQIGTYTVGVAFGGFRADIILIIKT